MLSAVVPACSHHAVGMGTRKERRSEADRLSSISKDWKKHNYSFCYLCLCVLFRKTYVKAFSENAVPSRCIDFALDRLRGRISTM